MNSVKNSASGSALLDGQNDERRHIVRRFLRLWCAAIALWCGVAHLARAEPEERCRKYATDSMAQVAQNNIEQCGLAGGNWNPDYNAHYNWCRGAKASSVDHEYRFRADNLSKCLNICKRYRDDAKRDVDKVKRSGCLSSNEIAAIGLEQAPGPRWSQGGANAQGHFSWCMGEPDLRLIEAERRGREERAERCVTCNGYASRADNTIKEIANKGCSLDLERRRHAGRYMENNFNGHLNWCMGHAFGSEEEARTNFQKYCIPPNIEKTCRDYADTARSAVDEAWMKAIGGYSGKCPVNPRWTEHHDRHYNSCIDVYNTDYNNPKRKPQWSDYIATEAQARKDAIARMTPAELRRDIIGACNPGKLPPENKDAGAGKTPATPEPEKKQSEADQGEPKALERRCNSVFLTVLECQNLDGSKSEYFDANSQTACRTSLTLEIDELKKKVVAEYGILVEGGGPGKCDYKFEEFEGACGCDLSGLEEAMRAKMTPKSPQSASCRDGMQLTASGRCACPDGTKFIDRRCRVIAAPAPSEPLPPPVVGTSTEQIFSCPRGTRRVGRSRICLQIRPPAGPAGGETPVRQDPRPDARPDSRPQSAPAACPPGTRRFGRSCIVIAKPRPRPPRPIVERCPQGMMGVPPNCCPPGTRYASGKCIAPAPTPQARSCRWRGMVGIPPNCFCRTGTTYRYGRCRPIATTPTPTPVPAPDTKSKPNWRKCPPGQIGRWPRCRRWGQQKTCTPPLVGTYPNCHCPKGLGGPNCKQVDVR